MDIRLIFGYRRFCQKGTGFLGVSENLQFPQMEKDPHQEKSGVCTAEIGPLLWRLLRRSLMRREECGGGAGV